MLLIYDKQICTRNVYYLFLKREKKKLISFIEDIVFDFYEYNRFALKLCYIFTRSKKQNFSVIIYLHSKKY